MFPHSVGGGDARLYINSMCNYALELLITVPDVFMLNRKSLAVALRQYFDPSFCHGTENGLHPQPRRAQKSPSGLSHYHIKSLSWLMSHSCKMMEKVSQ